MIYRHEITDGKMETGEVENNREEESRGSSDQAEMALSLLMAFSCLGASGDFCFIKKGSRLR